MTRAGYRRNARIALAAYFRRKATTKYTLVGYVHEATLRSQSGAPVHMHDRPGPGHLALYREDNLDA